MGMIDLRSDTVTRPSIPMLNAMMMAELGDDVFGEDPTVNRLQLRVAALFGKEDSLFVPSGTMGNQICIKAHTRPGDEVIVDHDAHILIYENAAPALLSGVQLKPAAGIRGVLSSVQLAKEVRPDAYYYPTTRLICLENTHGRSGGSVIPLEAIHETATFAHARGIKVHMDGARVWNAHVATGIPLNKYVGGVDSISACFSKGLGAPIGSIIAGSREFISEARRYRKLFGGGMRQVGVLAAAALYALDNNIERLRDDHEKARYLARELSTVPILDGCILPADTNMVIVDTKQSGIGQSEILDRLQSQGVLLTPERDSSIRAVMHLDVSMEQVHEVSRILKSFFQAF